MLPYKAHISCSTCQKRKSNGMVHPHTAPYTSDTQNVCIHPYKSWRSILHSRAPPKHILTQYMSYCFLSIHLCNFLLQRYCMRYIFHNFYIPNLPGQVYLYLCSLSIIYIICLHTHRHGHNIQSCCRCHRNQLFLISKFHNLCNNFLFQNNWSIFQIYYRINLCTPNTILGQLKTISHNLSRL